MERLGDRLGTYYSTWLASSLLCCLPRLQEQPLDEFSDFPPEPLEKPKRNSPIPLSRYNAQVISQQPLRQSHLSWPEFNKAEEPQERPRHASQHRSRHASQQTQYSKDRRSVVSRASKRARSLSRPRRNHSTRPTIGAPTDFRRSDASQFEDLQVDVIPRAASPPMRKLAPFRPLQLSIYVPGNELPNLPRFSDDPDEDVPLVPGIERPPQAVLKPLADSILPRSESILPRSDSILSRSTTSFSVPRKPVPSRANSAEPLRSSMESSRTYTNNYTHARSFSFDRARSHSNERRPSFATTRSAQEFLDALNAPLPPLPQPAPANPSDTSFSIYRRASEQSLRLRTHLEERQMIERKLPECETISEERSPVSPLSILQASPIFRSEPLLDSDRQIFVQQSIQQRDSIHHTAAGTVHPTDVDSVPQIEDRDCQRRASQARSSSDSSTLLNEKMHEAEVVRPTVTTTISVPNDSGSLRSDSPDSAIEPAENPITISQRLSQWLTRSLTTHHSHLRSRRPTNPNISRSHNSSSGRKWHDVHSAPNELADPWVPIPISNSGVTGKTEVEFTTRKRSNTQGSSVSTYITTRGLSIDLEKFPIPVVKDVGVAI